MRNIASIVLIRPTAVYAYLVLWVDLNVAMTMQIPENLMPCT